MADFHVRVPRPQADHPKLIGNVSGKHFSFSKHFIILHCNLKPYTMSEQIQFPQIPDDNHSKILLETLTKISDMIMKDGPVDEHASKCAAFLHFLGTAPLLADYLYFRVHEETRDMCRHLSDHYNYYIHSQGDAYKLELLNKEVKSFGDYFNHFQLALYYIDLKAKEDKRWNPLSDLVWGFYCSLYSYRKCEELLESVQTCLEKEVYKD